MEATQTTLALTVSGMTCGSCVRHVTEALQAVKGVADARVDLASGRATVAFDPAATTADRMVAAVEDAGYGVAVASDDRPAGLPVRDGCGSSCCA